MKSNKRIPEETHPRCSIACSTTSFGVYEYQRLGLTDKKSDARAIQGAMALVVGLFVLLQERVEAHLRAREMPPKEWASHSFITTLNRVTALERVVGRS